MGILGDSSGLVVTDVGVEGSHQHEALIENLLDVVSVRFKAGNTVHVETLTGVSHKADRLKYVLDNQGLEDVELKVAVHSSDGDCGVVSHDLSADHSDGFALSGVNFARHD